MFALPHPHHLYPLTGDLTLRQLYLGLQGRIGRRSFWLHGVLGLSAFSLLATALFEIAGLRPEHAEGAANLLVAWPLLAISAKRWHDRDLTGWLALLWLVPVVGQIGALVCNGFLPGQKGDNRFGPAPSR
jgi:uncharacterized membrane protein YhaH (DUF805 family)